MRGACDEENRVAQLFGPGATQRFRAFLVGVPLLISALAVAWGVIYRSSFYTGTDMHIEQPVPFSHQHHVSGLGIDCRFCHASVETSAFAGMPSTKTCMRCHSQIWSDSPLLAPVRESYASGKPLHWTRVYDLPDFVYFDHSIHVAKGVGCSTCHGAIDQMPLTAKAHALHMRWCVDCHRDPHPRMRPPDEVFDMSYVPGHAPEAQLARLDLPRGQRENCWICHR
jgi:cytochrome c7-like protein/class III cytochrome C family protein